MQSDFIRFSDKVKQYFDAIDSFENDGGAQTDPIYSFMKISPKNAYLMWETMVMPYDQDIVLWKDDLVPRLEGLLFHPIGCIRNWDNYTFLQKKRFWLMLGYINLFYIKLSAVIRHDNHPFYRKRMEENLTLFTAFVDPFK